MSVNGSISSREAHQHSEQEPNESGPRCQRSENPDFDDYGQFSFQDINWVGLSPRNKGNQMRYKRTQEQLPQASESDELPENDIIETPVPLVRRRRFASHPLANSHPSKRRQGHFVSDTAFTPQPKSVQGSTSTNAALRGRPLMSPYFQQHSNGKFYSPHLFQQAASHCERDARDYLERPSQLRQGENRDRCQSRAISQTFSAEVPHHRQTFYLPQYGGPSLDNFPSIDRRNSRRGQSVILDSFQGTPYRQNAMSMAPDTHLNYRTPPDVADLTTPDSAYGRGNAIYRTNSGWSGRRKCDEFEYASTEDVLDSDWDNPAEGSYPRRSYQTTGTSPNDLGNSITNSRARSMAPRNECRTPHPQLVSSGRGQLSRSAFANDSFPQQSLNITRGITPPYFSPMLSTEKIYNDLKSRRATSGVLYQPTENEVEPQIYPEAAEDDTSGDETLEGLIRSTSRSSRPQKANTLTPGRSSKIAKVASLVDLSTSSGQHIVISQTPGALVKENEEQRRQKLAEEKIALQKRRAQQLQNHDDLFDEPPTDEDKVARIKWLKEIEKAKKNIREDAKIVTKYDKKIQEELEATRKRRAAEDAEQKRAEKRQRVTDEQRQLAKEKEAERLEAKRKAAEELRQRNRNRNELERIEAMMKIEADKQAARRRAARLQPAKKIERINSTQDTIQQKDSSEIREARTPSGGGLFIQDDDHAPPPRDELPKRQHVASVEKETIGNQTSINESENVVDPGGTSTTVNPLQVPETIADKLSDQSCAVPTVQKPQTPTDIACGEELVISNIHQPRIISDLPAVQSTEISDVQRAQYSPDHSACAPEEVSNLLLSEVTINGANDQPSAVTESLRQPQMILSKSSGMSICAAASDERRQPPDISKPRDTPKPKDIYKPKPRESSRARNGGHASKDPISFVTGGSKTSQSVRSEQAAHSSISNVRRTSQGTRNADQAEGKSKLIIERSLKQVEKLNAEAKLREERCQKEWDERIAQLDELIKSQSLHTLPTGKGGQPLPRTIHPLPPLTNHPKSLSLTSQINLVSEVELQRKEKENADRAKLAKYEKHKASSRKRYEREIRSVLAGQGIELEEDKIMKQVDERMAVWEDNRKKKELKGSGGRSSGTRSQSVGSRGEGPDQEPPSPPTLPISEDQVKDTTVQITEAREQAMRAGVEFLASQNKARSDFAKAASKSRIEDLDSSEESEEDPDDEPGEKLALADKSGTQASQDANLVESIEISGTICLDNFDARAIPPLLETSGSSQTRAKSMLPDLVNPAEEDMMHSYVVKHRAERGDDIFISVTLGSFHNLEEANAFAQQKLLEFHLGPSTGRSETHDDDNLYIGTATTDKTQNHCEVVWVTREIIYIGDVANLKRGDLKPIIQPKVFNVVEVMEGEGGKYDGRVVATTSIKALANKKAADHFLTLSKPSRPRLDWLHYFDGTLAPMVRENLKQADDIDEMVQFEGLIQESQKSFTVSVWENPVVGPLN